LNVAVTSLCARRWNSYHHDVRSAARDRYRLLEVGTKRLFVGDDVVGRKHPNDSRGIMTFQNKRREPDRRRSVAPDWLGYHLVRIQPGKLLHAGGAQVPVSDVPQKLTGRQRLKPLYRFLDHALRAIEGQ